MDKKKISIGLLATAINKKYRDQIQACQTTWIQTAQECNIPVYFLCGHKAMNEPLKNVINFPDVQEDVKSALNKQFKGLKWLLDHSPSHFYMIAGSDNYIRIANLLKLLMNYSCEDELYIGGHGDYRKMLDTNIYFHSGGAGIIISHALLEKLYSIYTPELIIKLWKISCAHENLDYLITACDVALGYIFHYMGIKPTIVENMYGCDFRGRHTVSSLKCSVNCHQKTIQYQDIITSHYVDPYQMHAIHELHQFDAKDKTDLYKEVNSKWTLVTFLYDMSKYGNEAGKGMDHYIKNAETLFCLNINLVIYCDPDLAEKLLEGRRKYGFESQTIIRAVPLTETTLYKMKDKIAYNRQHVKRCADPRNTIVYFTIVASKHLILKKEIELNPFNSQYFAWIDIGIGNTVGIIPYFFYSALSLYRDKVCHSYIDYTPESITRNNEIYYEYGRCGMANSFMTGRANYMLKVCQFYEEVMFKTIEAGYGHIDEQFMPLINFDHPELFEFTYGDYGEQFTNYGKYKFNPQITLHLLIPKLLADNKHLMCYNACKTMLDAYEEGNTFFEFSDLVKLTQNYYVSAYYLRKIDECWQLMKKYDQYHEYEGFKEIFNQNIDYVIRNTDFMQHHINQKLVKIETTDLNSPLISKYIKSDYKVFVYGPYPNSVKSLVHQNPVIRNINSVLNLPYEINLKENDELFVKYNEQCQTISDINEHLPTLYRLATKCQSVLENGVRTIVSSWAFLYGLSHSLESNKKFFMCDIEETDCTDIFKLSKQHQVDCSFHKCSDLNLDLKENVDMTFIDTWHVYGQLKRELAKFHQMTNKFIVLHDTTIDAIQGESIRREWDIDQDMKNSGYTREEVIIGLWPAVEEFLNEHQDWVLVHRYTNNNGLTILARTEYIEEAKMILDL